MSYAGTKALILKQVDNLRLEIPSLYLGSEDEWSARRVAYWEKLRKFDLHVVEEACKRSQDRWPHKFPNLGELTMLCRQVVHEGKVAQTAANEQNERAGTEREERANVTELRLDIPNDPGGQAAYIAGGGSIFEDLARRYEVSSKNLALDPMLGTPDDVRTERWGQFREAWAEHDRQYVPPGRPPLWPGEDVRPGPPRDPGQDG